MGAGGKIIVWNDTLSSWLIDNSPTTQNLYTVELVSSSDGWAMGANGTIVRVTGSGGGGYPASGTFLSQVLNSDGVATTWETLYWNETLPVNTDLTVAVRSGNVGCARWFWSAFSSEYTDPTSTDINLSGQYFQHRISLQSSDSFQTPQLNEITVTYKP